MAIPVQIEEVMVENLEAGGYSGVMTVILDVMSVKKWWWWFSWGGRTRVKMEKVLFC